MSNKFENIKEGDTVYVNQSVRYGFNSERWFYIPIKVIKITKTQFTCENTKRYQKDSGREIGGGYQDRANLESRDVFDQMKEMREFAIRVKEINKTTSLVCKLDKIINKINPDIDIKIMEDFNIYAEKLLSAIIKGV